MNNARLITIAICAYVLVQSVIDLTYFYQSQTRPQVFDYPE